MARVPKALVADDNSVNRMVAKRMLQRYRIDTDQAADGLEAVAKCMNTNYDIVLMDVCMPNKDGIEATKELLRNGYSTPIIGYTASEIVLHNDLLKAE